MRSLAELANWLGRRAAVDLQVAALAVDSRDCAPGSLFFALPGERTHGEAFLGDAAKRGAVAAVVAERYEGGDFGMELLRVPNVLRAMQDGARTRLEGMGAKVLALTGSVGKTTTRNFLVTLLQDHFCLHTPAKNQNSQIGLPLGILQAVGDEELFVLEMAMTEAGQIRNLVEIAPPDVALLTAVELVHAQWFDSLGAIASAKGEIFSHSHTQLGILPLEVAHFDELARIGKCPKSCYSISSPDADLYFDGTHFFERGHRRKSVSFTLPGLHMRHDLCAAVAAARAIGLPWEGIAEAVPKMEPVARRMEILARNGVTIVNDSYNACTASICAAIDALPEPKVGGRRIAVLSHIVELGDFSDQCHVEVAKHALGKVDSLLCIGERCGPMVDVWKAASGAIHWCQSRAELIDRMKQEVKPGDVVLLKGGRVFAMEELVGEI